MFNFIEAYEKKALISNIQYEGIYGELQDQISVTILYFALLELRERLLTGGVGLPRQSNSRLSDIIINSV